MDAKSGCPNLAFEIKFYLNTAKLICIWFVYSCFLSIRTELRNCGRPHSLGSRQYLVSGPLQKEFATPRLMPKERQHF